METKVSMSEFPVFTNVNKVVAGQIKYNLVVIIFMLKIKKVDLYYFGFLLSAFV